MNQGLYVSASGALVNLYRQDVTANNLANLETVGFKPDVVDAGQRRVATAGQGLSLDARWMLERLGGAPIALPPRVDVAQAPLLSTGSDLDLAVEGEGFFAVQDGPATRLTRDGRFTLDASGTLVSSASRLPLLDESRRPIRVDPSVRVDIDTDGRITQADRTVARLQLVAPASPGDIVKVGNDLLRALDDDPDTLRAADGRIRQGFTESSGVDAIMTLNDMISRTKAVQSNLKMMQYHDHIIGQTVNTFGRVA